MKKIVVLGSTNTDMVTAGKKIPVPGKTISGGTFLMNPGGKGANQTVAAAAKWAHAKGVPVILNTAPAAKLPKDLYKCLDWITPNETEAEGTKSAWRGLKVPVTCSRVRYGDFLPFRGSTHYLLILRALADATGLGKWKDAYCRASMETRFAGRWPITTIRRPRSRPFSTLWSPGSRFCLPAQRAHKEDWVE